LNDVENILRQRAIKAAQRLETTEIIDAIEVIYFKIQDEIYAIEAEVVSEVHNFKEPIPVPFTPSYIHGIFHMRSKFVSLVDFRSFLGIREKSEKKAISILLLSDEIMEFGIAVDEVLEQQKLSKKDIQNLSLSFDLPRADLVIGVTEDGVIVLDGKKLLADPAMITHK
jgi:purine-binding chemotaxis protein CheW